MGVIGRRPIKQSEGQYHEPQLVVNVEDIISRSIQDGAVDSKGNIDITHIAKLKEIEISYETMEPSQSGYLKNVDNKWVIGVNKLHNQKRQRFTIAHELGHFFMHKEKKIDFEDATFFRTENSTSIEYAANEFAAKLLMPENRIREAIDGGMKNLEKLAELFDVSAMAIKYRVVSLGYKMKEHE